MWRTIPLIGVLVLVPALASAQPCTTDGQRVVDAIYRQILERPADRGSGNFVERLENGSANVRDLVREVAKSQEHVQRFLSNPNREEGAAYLYRHLLGRQPDADGQRSHAQGLAKSGPGPVIDNFIDSPEYQQSFGNDAVPGRRVRYCGPGPGGEDPGPFSGNNRREIRFQNLDRNFDGIITRSEWRGTRESFVLNDWNGDNVLSGEEVRVGGRRSEAIDRRGIDDEGLDPTASANDRLSRFEALDTNNNNRIERNEWQGSRDAFGWLDRNSDNVLSRGEVVGQGNTAVDRFSNLDVDRDGRLSFDEWNWSRASFDRRDTNQDGIISRREFMATIR